MDERVENNPFQWYALAGLSILAFIAFLDSTIVLTVLPAIQHHFNVGVIKLQWIVSAFTLTNCMFMVIAGKLGDLFGHRRIFYLAVFIFGLSALGAGVSPTINWVIFFRALQGTFSAGIFGIAVALIAETFPQEKQTKAVGIYSAITGLGLAIGPFLGGLIITFLSWRWVFFLNIPIILVGWLFTSFSLKKSQPSHDIIKIDWLGLLLLIISIGSLVYGLIRGGEFGWHQPIVWLLLVIALLALIALIATESRAPQPLLQLEIFSNRYLVIAILSVVGGGMVSGIFMVFNPLFLDTILKQTPFIIGLMLVAIPFMQVIFSFSITIITKLVSIENAVILAQLSLFIAAVLHYFMTANSTITYIIIAFLFLGIPWGAANTCAVAIVHQRANPKHIGSIIGTVFTTWNVCGSIMLAISVVIFHSRENYLMNNYLSQSGIILSQQQKNYIASILSDPQHASKIIEHFANGRFKGLYQAFHQAFLSGFHSIMLFTIAASLLLLLITSILNFKKSK